MDKADGRTEKRLSRNEQTAGVHDDGPNQLVSIRECWRTRLPEDTCLQDAPVC